MQERIGHHFADPFLLETALTHRSYGTPNNERMEFVGDGVLNCAVADLLFRRFADLPEGDLTRLRANLVRQDTLHQLALKLELGPCLKLGDGELKSGGAARPSMLADALEAVLGAIYLDAGFPRALSVIDRHYADLIAGIDLSKSIKDAKSRLQEVLQGRKIGLPVYALAGSTGELHVQEFEVTCRIEKLGIVTQGTGSSRRIAEQRAARLALAEIEQMHPPKHAGGRR